MQLKQTLSISITLFILFLFLQTSAQNVGIGTTNPIQKLHVAGTIHADGYVRSQGRFFFFGDNQYLHGDNNSTLYFRSNNPNRSQFVLRDSSSRPYGKIYGFNGGSYFGLYDVNNKPFVQLNLDNYLRFLVGNSEKIRIESTGDVGIGTTNPSFRLDIFDPALAVMQLRSSTDHAIVQLSTVANKGNYLRFNRAGNASYWIYNTPTNDLQFRPLAGTAAVHFKENGRVGVGTGSPAHSFHTTGDIRADGRTYYFGATQNLYGNDASAFYLKSNHSTVTQMIFRDLEETEYGRIVGAGNGDYFTLHEGKGKPFLQSYVDNYVRILISNSEKLRVLNNGDVGIGITAPTSRLHIRHTGTNLLKVESTTTNSILAMETITGRANSLRFLRNGASSFFINNTASNHLHFRPLGNATPSVAFTAGGDVGVGTTTPAHSIHTTGNVRSDGRKYYFGATQNLSGDNSSAVYSDANHSTVTQMIFRDKELTPYGRIVGAGNGDYFTLHEGKGKPFLQSYVDNYVRILITNSEKMRVLANGHVGVGITAPASRLHVVNSGTNLMKVQSTGNNTILAMETIAGKANSLRFLRNGASSFFINNTSGNDLQFRPLGNATPSVTFKANGNVGVGTNTPTYKFEVNGLTRTKEVIITLSNWPDYVFKDSYELPTLKDEAEYIQDNGHLSGFESEADMEGKMTVGDVTKRQQEKIEQMMLHLIDMNKKMDQRDQQMDLLLNKVQTMQQEIEQLQSENQQLKGQ